MYLPDHAPFDAKQRESIAATLQSLSPQQTAWLSGFLAGNVDPSATAAPVANRIPLTIVYGSESGNAESVADLLKKESTQRGLVPTVHDMGDIEPAVLKKAANLIVVVSTWGEGDPPDRATSFYTTFMSDSAPRLEQTRFAVLALGDTSYEHFCKIGKDFDSRLESLGAKRFYDRVDCDVDFETPAQQWIQGALDTLQRLQGSAVPAMGIAATAKAPAAASDYSKKNPFPAPLKKRILLNGRGSNKETLHLEFSLAESGMTYQPGDALALIPSNCSEVVDSILQAGKFSTTDEHVRDALLYKYDITGLNASILQKYNQFAQSAAINRLLLPENKPQLQEYIHGREIIDVLTDFPVQGLKFASFTEILRPIPPKLYSIASSLKAHPDEVHLTVAVVRYQSHGRDRKGVASTFLSDRIQPEATAPVYIHKNKNFKLPEDDSKPMIMVGPGTGIAPFRAFVEERAATGASGQTWLFFGDQHYTYDFLYQTEWQDHLKAGSLNRLDVAFSRDTRQKYYVQHAMLKQSKDIYAWLEEGGYVYVCGDATRMAGDVHEALIEIVHSQQGRNREDAIAYVEQLKKERRYQRDVY